MEREIYEIQLRTPSGSVIVAQVELVDDEDCVIVLTSSVGTFTAKAADYFDAFSEIRCNLAKLGLLPSCYGASRNVFPSNTSRQMGGGLKAYRLTLGQQARMDDMVCIFDSSSDLDLCQPEEQQEFHRLSAESVVRQ